MGWMYKGIPIPTLIALAILIFGGILHIIGVATPYWHTVYLDNSLVKDQANNHYGLWIQCNLVSLDLFDCTDHAVVHDYIVATRAMEILALVMGVACIIITGIWSFLKIQKYYLVLTISCLGTGFLAGLFGIIGIIIYASNVTSITVRGNLFSYELSWSFALCVVSSCLVFVATVLLGLGTRMMNR